MASKLIEWFTDRWPVRPALRWSLEEEIPGGDSFWYSLGSATLFVFVIQVVTGLWQMFWYVPTTDHAYQSVMYIRQEVPFGWLIHGLHAWGSNIFIVLMFLHMVRVFVWGAYKQPRQLTWLLGCLLFFTVLGMTFTGALLPWDELGYWAAEVGTSIAGTVPVVGFFLKELIRGGAAMSQETLSRFFLGHIALLPGVLAALILAHVVAFRQYGSVGPWHEEKRLKSGRFWPDQIVKDLIVILVVFLGLVGLSAFWRAPVTGPADPIDNILTPKPEWQFLSLYQFLKLFKGRWEPVGTTGVPLLLFLIIVLLPFYDRSKKRNPLRRPIAMTGAFLLIAWIGVYTYLGYRSKPGASATASVKVSASASPGVKAGATLFSQQGCFACHTVHGQGGNVGPNLSNIGAEGRSRQWLTQQIRNPKSHDPSTKMPAFDSLSGQQVGHLVDFLESLGGHGGSASSTSPSASKQSGGADASSPTSEQTFNESTANLAAQGQKLIRSQSCLQCHAINGQGGNVGPDLSKEGTKGRSLQWLTQQIRNPKSHNATTVMPSFGALSDRQVMQLVAYLETLGTGNTQSQSSPSSSQSDDPNIPRQTSQSDPSSTQVSALIQQGRKLFHSQSCLGCHTVNGQGGDIGPNLSKEGTKGRSQDWLKQQLRDPKSHNPQTAMPPFTQLSDQQIKELVVYLQSLGVGSSSNGTLSDRTTQDASNSPASAPTANSASSSPPTENNEPNTPAKSPKPNVPATGQQGPPARAAYLVGQTIHGIGTIGNPMHGKLLFDKWCQRCHGQDGLDHVKNPGSDDGTVPPLNPIDPALYNENPVTFAENIDRYIQHGSMPDGPDPAQHMPAWGDDLTLTQEMISEIEAYVLKLNGVDRAKIMNPGVRPWVFFLICLIVITLAISVRGLYLGFTAQDRMEASGNEPSRPAPPESPTSGGERPSPNETPAPKESDIAEGRNPDHPEPPKAADDS